RSGNSCQQILLAPKSQRSRTGDPRPQLKYLHLFSVEIRQVFREVRSGANQRHVATNHVPQLWQFVQLAAPEHATESGDSPVFSLSKVRASVFAEVSHGSKLEDLKTDAVFTTTNLAKKHRPW